MRRVLRRLFKTRHGRDEAVPHDGSVLSRERAAEQTDRRASRVRGDFLRFREIRDAEHRRTPRERIDHTRRAMAVGICFHDRHDFHRRPCDDGQC